MNECNLICNLIANPIATLKTMKTLLLLLFIIFSLAANATNYYLSNNGNDANNGISTSTSWKTLDKINSSTFLPGDFILFNKGDTWIGRLNVPSSGSLGNPITFGNYGSGVNPIIDANNANTRCISTDSKAYITIDGIDLKNGTNYGIGCSDVAPSNNIIIKNLTISYIGTTNAINPAISETGGYTIITNCTIINLSLIH